MNEKHNGIKVTTENGVTTLQVFLADEYKSWVEFDKQQLTDLIELLNKQLPLLEKTE